MADAPIGYTTTYNLAKWAEDAYPGATALNENWDLIDDGITSASLNLTAIAPLYRFTDTILLSYNVDNFKLTGPGLNTIQNIDSGSAPTFAGAILSGSLLVTGSLVRIEAPTTRITGSVYVTETITLGTPTTEISQSVRADRNINTDIPMTGGGNLTADRTIALDINNTNLETGSNNLNTIQDIHTTADPLFNSLHLTDTIMVSGSGDNVFWGNIEQSGSVTIHNDFLSGWTGAGHRLDRGITNTNTSTLELDDLWVRGTMNVYELIIQQIRATNGSVIVTAAGKVEEIIDATVGAEIFTIEDPGDHSVTPFLENDIIMVQRVSLDSLTVVKRLVRVVDSLSANEVTVTTLGDAPSNTGVVEEGDDFVRIGNTTNAARDASIYITADDSNAPYIDIIDGVHSWTDWTDKSKVKARMGRLSGVIDDTHGALSGYGLYANKVYLSASGSVGGISLSADENSSTLKLISGSNTIFEFDTATSTALMAGWELNQDKFYKNSFGGLQVMEMNPSQSHFYTGATLIGTVDKTVNEKFYSILGAIPNTMPGNSTIYSGDRGFLMGNQVDDIVYMGITDNRANIAGWTFDGDKLYNGTDIVLDGANKKVSVYNDTVQMYYSATNDYGISGPDFQLGSSNYIANFTFGDGKLYAGTSLVMDALNTTISVANNAVKMYYAEGGAEYGISGSNFHIGSTNEIAGWTIDKDQLTKDNVSLMASSSLQGLSVTSGSFHDVKVGEFTPAASFTYDTAGISTTPSDPGIAYNTKSGSEWEWDNSGTPDTLTPLVTTPEGGWDPAYIGLTQSLAPAEVKGKTVRVTFAIQAEENGQGSGALTGSAYLETDLGTISYTDVSTPVQVIPANTWYTHTVIGHVPDVSAVTYVKMRYRFANEGNGTEPPGTIKIKDYTFDTYEGSHVEISSDGFRIGQSPISEFVMSVDGNSLTLEQIKANSILEIGDWRFSTEAIATGSAASKLSLYHNDTYITGWTA